MRILTLAIALAAAGPALAQDFSEGSEAKSWNLYAEQPARFEATVVDMLCEVAGDCENECADDRQLGLLRTADSQLVYPNKNSQPAFTGAAVELLPFCGKAVEVDGLEIDDPEIGAQNVYLVQRIREQGDGEWVAGNRWTKIWGENHPDADGDGPWFRRDPRIGAMIDADGYLGTGESHQEAWDLTQ